MGNQESKHSSASHGGSSSNSGYQNVNATAGPTERKQAQPRRRESIHTLSAGKASASPSASLTSATASTTQSAIRAKDSLKKAAPPPPPSSIPPIPTPHLQPVDSTAHNTMGNSSSKSAGEKLASRDPPPGRPSPLPRPIDIEKAPPASVDVMSPILSTENASYQLPTPTQFSRPPRLPLPIEQEVHTPGSPIISPADLTAPIGPVESDPAITRRISVLSSTTADDDDLGDDLTALEGGLPTVPTILEWKEGGDKVYVTGTFARWDKKFRLHRNGPSRDPNALSAVIGLQPGTHHVRFIVDNEMKITTHMPTAVDYTNFLVNYIEVAAPVSAEPKEDSQVAKQAPVVAQPTPSKPIEYRVPEGIHPPHVLPPTPELVPVPLKPKVDPIPKALAREHKPSTDTLNSQIDKPKMAPVAVLPPKKYHREIPQFLLDLDAPEESSQFGRANAIVRTTPLPPSLPQWLQKSVLNGSTPMKDDASVLVIPNHTVLNHLATSSIKNKVLATSATTRYKRKFLTTIMYKPTQTGD